MTAAVCEACRVVLTDLEQIVPHIQRNVELNLEKFCCKVEVSPLDWDESDTALHSQFDIVIGADLLYDSAAGSGDGMYVSCSRTCLKFKCVTNQEAVL